MKNREFYKSKGLENYLKKNYEKSLLNYKKYLKYKTQDLESLFNVARIYTFTKKYQLAIDYYNKCLSEFSKNKNVLVNISSIYIKLNEYDKALDYLKRIDKNEHNDHIVQYNFGLCYERKNNYEESIKYYKSAINLNNNFLDALNNCGNCLANLGRYQEAISNYNKVLNFDKNNITALLNLGSSYADLELYDKAIIVYDKIIKINPNFSFAYNNKANVLSSLRNYDEAIKASELAIKYNSKNSNFKLNKGVIFLKEGKYIEGFENYENRLADKKIDKNIPFLDNVNYQHNKNIYIWSEQGVGDQILYSKYLHDISKNFNIFLDLDRRIKPIIKRTYNNIKFYDEISGFDKKKFDYQLSLSSLPKFFVKNSDDLILRKNILLKINTDLKQEIVKRNQLKEKRFICGLSWKTSVKNIRHKKSLKLLDLLKTFGNKKTLYVNLQYGDVESEINDCRKNGFEILNDKSIDNFKDIDHLYSLIDCCNCVISTSNSNAHFSGSIGKKTYLLLPYDFYWYWRSDKNNENYWYQNMTVFKKNNPEDEWKNLFIELKKKMLDDFRYEQN